MSNTTHYRYTTKIGTFSIYKATDGWRIALNGDYIDGPHPSAQRALDNLANGHCMLPGLDESDELGLPDEIGEWSRLR